MNTLFEAVENKNVPEVVEILKQCSQEILEFKGGRVIYFLLLIVAAYVFVLDFQHSTIQKYIC